ncbi:MAG: antibiotic biosynthesis monooxygenase [Chloroflexi bacterium]|nr:antibiotic biosynthesis monooxygenase [Chloroflexota bacterium]
MAVKVTIGLKIIEARLDEFKQVLKEALPDTRAFVGCISVAVLEDHEEPGSITLLEEWDSVEDQVKYINWRTETGMMETLGSFVEAEPVITYFEKLDI